MPRDEDVNAGYGGSNMEGGQGGGGMLDRGGRRITRGLERLLGRQSTGPRAVFGAPEAMGAGGGGGGMLGGFGQQQPGMMGSIYQGNPYLNQGGPPGAGYGAPMMSQGNPQTIQDLYSMYGIPMQGQQPGGGMPNATSPMMPQPGGGGMPPPSSRSTAPQSPPSGMVAQPLPVGQTMPYRTGGQNQNRFNPGVAPWRAF